MSSVGAPSKTATLLRTNVPKELQEREQWLPAKVVTAKGKKKKKIAFWKAGKFAKWKSDKSQRMSFEDALSFVEAKGYDGVSYVPIEDEPIWFVDLDEHIQEGRVSPYARNLVQSLDSYTELSESDEGYHILGWAEVPRDSRGGRKRASLGLEVYVGLCKPIFFTGKKLQGSPAGLEERTEQINRLLDKEFKDRTSTEKEKKDVPVLPNSLTDEELISRMTGRKAKWAEIWEGNWEPYYPSHSEAVLGLASELAFWSGNDRERIDRLMRQSELLKDTDRLTKWERVHSSGRKGKLTYGEMTIEKALRTRVEDLYRGGQGKPAIKFSPVEPEELLPEDDRRLIDLLIVRGDLERLRLILTTMAKTKTLPYLRDKLREAESSLWGENAAKKRASFFSHVRFSDDLLSEQIEADIARWGYELKLCVLDDRVYINGVPQDDITRSVIRVRARDEDYGSRRIPLAALDDVIKAQAAKNVFHPIKVVLEAQEWDGEDHITEFCQYIKTREDGKKIVYQEGTEGLIKETFIRKWLVGAIARVYELTQNEVLVLASTKQELGKTRTAAWLASPFEDSFYEGEIDPSNKHHMRFLASKFIWDVSELDATTRKRDISALKFFLTQTYSSFDVKYITYEIKKPALASFIASVNGSDFLSDMTGNRRFRVLNVIEIDQSYRDTMEPLQIWAQAYVLYKEGESWLLTEEEREARDKLNEEHTLEAPYMGLIQRYYSILSPEEAERAAEKRNTEWHVHTQDLIDVLKDAGVREGDRTIQMHISRTTTFLKLPKRKLDNLWGYYGLHRNTTSTGLTY